MSEDEAPPAGSAPRTVLRPTPGGRRPAVSGGPEPAERPAAASRGVPVDLAAYSSGGINPLVEAATPLLMMAVGLRGTREHSDVGGLRAHAVREARLFDGNAAEHGMSPESIHLARYSLCTFIDEIVMNTPWGASGSWAGQPLLLALHNDTGGGEKVFRLIERELAAQKTDPSLLEFFFLLLSLGFQGQYRILDSGQRDLAEVRERLYARIRTWRERPAAELSAHWQGVEDRRSRLARELPAWVLVVVVALVCSGVFFTLRTRLSSAAGPLVKSLNEVRQRAFDAQACSAPQPASAPRPSLAALLAGESPDQLTVIEDQGNSLTTVVLKGEIFASGSAEVSSAFRPLLERIGDAVAKVGGRVQVQGHSDSAPIRSLKFKDNYELSELRAENAAMILRSRSASDPSRISAVGIGADKPRHQPADAPQNRALNRRIEIVHRGA